MTARQLCLSIFLIICSTSLDAQYSIKGNVNMKGDWQSQVFLATIDRLDEYYSYNAEYIVNSAVIDINGNFELVGDNLPNYSQFYRLYVVKEAHSEFNACLFEGGDEHNFIHLILNNDSNIQLTSDKTTYAPFGDYRMTGSMENSLMKELSNLIYPSYMFYEIKFPSELQFSRDKLNRDLFQFADSCSHDLVSLAAINSTDYESFFDTYYNDYQKMLDRLKTNYPKHPYLDNYKRKLRYYSSENLIETPFWKYLSFFLMGLLGLCFYLLYYQALNTKKGTSLKANLSIDQFTSQEVKIMDLIKEGNSNKEIAAALFIELSTVKSHINKIYSKLNVKNRSEALKMLKSL